MRLWRKRIMSWLVILFLTGLPLSWFVGSWLMSPKPSEVSAPDTVALRASDGIALAGTYWPGRRADAPGVLLLHGNGGSRDAVAGNAAWLAEQGYAVLAIDFRGHGRSGAAMHSYGWHESRDARAAFAWLKQHQQGAKVAVVGISLGGASSLLGEDGPLPADALVLQAVYPVLRNAIRNRIASITGSGPALLLEPLLSFQTRPRLGIWPSRLAPIEAVRHYKGPVFVIGGAADRYTPPAETRALLAAAPNGRGLWFAPGADHAATCVLETPAYRAQLLRFFGESIGRP